MKKIKSLSLLLLIFLQSQICSSQAPVVPIDVNQDIRCNGGNNGSLTASPTYGTSPYTFLWNTGATTQTLNSLAAGVYSVTVTDFHGVIGAGLKTLIDPPSLVVQLIPTNILCNGGNTGNVGTDVRGGTPSYTYLWTPTNDVTTNIRNITAGNYSVVVTDQNGCTTAASVTLTQPPPIQLNINPNISHNGYAVSCFKGSDGIINMSVSGGTGAGTYSYLWTTLPGAVTSVVKDPMNLKSGTYQVVVTDANGCTAPGGPVTLYEPPKINILLTPYVWPNGYNVSCFGCFNGSITSNVTGGIAPYIYSWMPSGQATANATNLDARATTLNVMDANQCLMSEVYDLRGPSDSWKITGNAGTNGSINYLGTNEPTDFTLKTNLIQRIKVTADGKVGIGLITPTKDLDVNGSIRFRTYPSSAAGFSLLKTDVSGNLSNVPESTNPSSQVLFGNGSWGTLPAGSNAWTVNGNNIYRDNGNVGIGTTNPTAKLEVSGDLKVSGSISLTGSTSQISSVQIHTNKLEVGNSVWIGGINEFSTYNDIFTDDGPLAINCHPGDNHNTILNMNDGKVGIGISSPTGRFEVKEFNPYGVNTFEILSNDVPNRRGISIGLDQGGGNADGSFNFWIHKWQNVDNSCAFNFKEAHDNTTLMKIQKDGKVVIGHGLSTPGSYNLYVANGILTEKVKVAVAITADWSDKVFNNNYNLKSLPEVEEYIKKFKHLPEIPSAEEVVSSGIDLGKMDAKLLQKIEELMLYIIKLNKEIDALKAAK
jgi:hypothetical protein